MPDRHTFVIGQRFGDDAHLCSLRKEEQTPDRTGMFDHGGHETFDEAIEKDLA